MAVSCAVFVSLLFAGCQSGAQYDQAARELRMQEDELYAMEDYLDQYQKLVCKYRAENAALKRQLAANGGSPATSTPRTLNGTRPTPTGPEIDVTPPTNGTGPQPDLEAPEVPPLQETTSVSDVWLHGEIVENEAGGGPRMVVEIEPLDAESRVVAFDGALSLMLTESDDLGGKVSVARWDYRPHDVREAVDSSSGNETIRFQLELPPDTPALDASELWVRMLPRRGGKLLAHTEIDLQQPSLFSSKGEFAPGDVSPTSGEADESPVVTAVYEDASHDEAAIEEASPTDLRPVSGEIFDGGWTIARPGHPAGLPENDEDANSEWRASLEPPPIVTASSTSARPKPQVSRPRDAMKMRDVAGTRTPMRAGWSPDRLNGASPNPRTASARPAWSATR